MAGVALFNQYTGKPRHPSDIQSDPAGALIWDGETPLKSAPMPKPTEPKRPPGRPEVPEESRLRVGSIRLTEAQWEKLAALGGSAWLREKIKRAKPAPPKER